ncbi:YwmB family TATA-box binding protein [Halalkalibacter oceani]|uniref:YwmB family TATA-box binding protein n=1 Tax=Halalkalibacter oceani TaxID=1653776 RepID=UPI00339B9033
MAFWRWVVIGFVLSAWGYMHVQSSEAYDASIEPLTELLQFAEDEQLAVNEWQVRVREDQLGSVSKQAFIAKTQSLEKKLSGWEKESLSLEGSEWKALFTYHDPNQQMTESVQLFAYQDGQADQHTALLTYAVKGTNNPGEDLESHQNLVEQRIQQLGLAQSDVYVQIQAYDHNDRNVSNKQLARTWVTKLGAKKVEALNEESFVSLSAYNPDWPTGIVTNELEMNVQLAIREQGLGARTTVTLGTPIITTEY